MDKSTSVQSDPSYEGVEYTEAMRERDDRIQQAHEDEGFAYGTAINDAVHNRFERIEDTPPVTVVEKQMEALALLAKYEVTGNLANFKDAYILAFDSGYVGDSKTGFLKDSFLDDAFNHGVTLRQQDYTQSHKGTITPEDLTTPALGVAADNGQTYDGVIFDIDNEGKVHQWFDGHSDPDVNFVVHERSNLSASLSGLINVGKHVDISYLSTGDAIVSPSTPKISEAPFIESPLTNAKPQAILMRSLLDTIANPLHAIPTDRAPDCESAKEHKPQKSRSR